MSEGHMSMLVLAAQCSSSFRGNGAEPGMCGERLNSMYGTRDTSSNWEHTYTGILISNGRVPRAPSSCVFTRPCDAKHVDHGDVWTFLGTDVMLQCCQGVAMKNCEVDIRCKRGPERGVDKHIRCLDRCLACTRGCSLYDCGPRHAERLVR